jgi:hypothetical protein
MKYWLYKEVILREFKRHMEFLEYTMDLLKQDLDLLLQWGRSCNDKAKA